MFYSTAKGMVQLSVNDETIEYAEQLFGKATHSVSAQLKSQMLHTVGSINYLLGEIENLDKESQIKYSNILKFTVSKPVLYFCQLMCEAEPKKYQHIKAGVKRLDIESEASLDSRFNGLGKEG